MNDRNKDTCESHKGVEHVGHLKVGSHLWPDKDLELRLELVMAHYGGVSGAVDYDTYVYCVKWTKGGNSSFLP